MKRIQKKEEKKGWKWWQIVLLILFLLWLGDFFLGCEDLRQDVYRYGTSCSRICESFCDDEGYVYSDGYTSDDNFDYEYENRNCECSCWGCR